MRRTPSTSITCDENMLMRIHWVSPFIPGEFSGCRVPTVSLPCTFTCHLCMLPGCWLPSAWIEGMHASLLPGSCQA